MTTVRIAYVYAAPLVRRADHDSRPWVPVDRLDVEREKVMLTRVLKNSTRAVRWRETVATSSSFWQVVLHGCRVLHFTGHGMRDGSVCFEDSCGRLHAVDREALKALFTKGHARAEEFGSATAGVKCVFVSACHSESVAEAFVAAGVPHVVAVRTEDEIMDDASLKFAGAFYEALLADECQSVKQAFESAKTVVKLTAEDWAESEHTKFLLLGHGDSNERLFADAPSGRWVDETVRIDDRCPRPVQQFTSREADVQVIYQDVLHSRCVVIIGACGVGKTQVARRVASYVAERSALNTFSSVVSVDLKSIPAASDMALFFARALGISPTLDSFLIDLHTRYTPSNKCLVVVDSCEVHSDVLGEFLSTVAAHGTGLSFLLTSLTAFSLRDLACKEYTLRPLPPVDAARLFVARAPRPISEFHPVGPVDPFVALSRTHVLKSLRGHPGAICATVAKLTEYNLVTDEDLFLREIIPKALREFESESGRSILNVGLSSFFGSPTLPMPMPMPTPLPTPGGASAGAASHGLQLPSAAAYPTGSAAPPTLPAAAAGAGAVDRVDAILPPPASTASTPAVSAEVADVLKDPLGLGLWKGLHQQARFAGAAAAAGRGSSGSSVDLRDPALWRFEFVKKGLEMVFQTEAPFLLTKRPLSAVDYDQLINVWGKRHIKQASTPQVMRLSWFKGWWADIRQWLLMIQHAEDDWCCNGTVVHGFLVSEATKRLLLSRPPGSFLFRFSASVPGLIALSVNTDGTVNNFLIHPTHPGVLLITQGGGRHSFSSLLEMVESLPSLTHRVAPEVERPAPHWDPSSTAPAAPMLAPSLGPTASRSVTYNSRAPHPGMLRPAWSSASLEGSRRRNSLGATWGGDR